MWHKALLMGYSVRLELILVCCLNVFQLVSWVLSRGYSSFLTRISVNNLLTRLNYIIKYYIVY